MKANHLLVATIAIASLLLFSCNNQSKTASQENETKTEKTSNVLEIDSVLANAENLVNKTITFEGVCTHACKHGATKIFMMGSDDTQTIRVEAAELGAFDTKCVNSLVQVKGILREQRIDEDYLQKWEAEAKAEGKEKHGEEGEGGCASEKNARGETGNTVAERIADFRTKIADRKAQSGKAYLSFYFVEALAYEIQ